MKQHTTIARRACVALFAVCATQAGMAAAWAAPTGADQIDSILVPVATANAVFGLATPGFSSSEAAKALAESEKATAGCANAQAVAFADPWTAYRSVHYSTYNNLGPTQRVAIYADEASAKGAFGKLAAQLASCKTAAAPATPSPVTTVPTTTATEPTTSTTETTAPVSDPAGAPGASAAPAPVEAFTVSVATADDTKWSDYVGFNQVSGLKFHCFREAHQRGAVVLEAETCDLDENGSQTSALADKMLAQVSS